MNWEQLTPDSIEQWAVALAALAGTVGTVGSILASSLPKHWRLTQTLTQLFADLRAVRTPDVPPQVDQLPPVPPPPRPVQPPPRMP